MTFIMRFFGISNFGMANTEYFSPTLRWYPWTSQLLISGMMIFTIFQPTEIPAPFPPANQQTWPNIDATTTNLTNIDVICGGGLRRTTCHMQNKTPTTQVDRFAIRISHLKHEISHFFFKYHPPLIQLLATVLYGSQKLGYQAIHSTFEYVCGRCF